MSKTSSDANMAAVLPSDSDSETKHVPMSRSGPRLLSAVGATAAVVCVIVASKPRIVANIEGLIERTLVDPSECSWGLQNCNETRCCNNPGMQCYEQSHWYAQCRESCTKGPDPSHWDGEPWTCKALGERNSGEPEKCSMPGENCLEIQCCALAGTQCFKKTDDWATCKSECRAGSPDLLDTDGHLWSCETLGEWKHGAQDWVREKCTGGGDDCSASQCCAEPGMQCYRKSEFWAQCKASCDVKPDPWGPEWTCEELGTRTPVEAGPQTGKMGEWVPEECAGDNEDCSKSRCCLGMNQQCYAKSEGWATCYEIGTCKPGVHEYDDNVSWSCEELGPPMVNGLGIKGSPSLFCWSLFQVTTYEMGIMQKQMEMDAGIFQCDDWALLSTAEPTVIGSTKDGLEAKTQQVKMAKITTSQDGTAGNAKLFINCWNVVLEDGRWRRHAWIIKVDPDAVILPWRVRSHLSPYVMQNVYVVNCNAFPSSPNFPMMYGSVEIFTYLAIDTYDKKRNICEADMGMMLPKWGEDYYMTHCLDHIGVGRISDFVSVGDNVCTGGSCDDGAFSAFHPKKSTDEWQECWDLATGKMAPTPAPWA
jgi:hypothetical protein